MAEFVEQSLEELVPVFEQLNATQLLAEKEVNLFIKRCRRYDYRLQKSHKKPEDFLNYAAYLTDMLELLGERRKAIGYPHKKEIIEFAIKRKTASLYRRLCERFQGKLEFWLQYINFTSTHTMKAQTSKAFIQAMQMHPRSIDLRLKAARWEWEENKSIDNARRGLQLALRLLPESVHLWATFFDIELDYVKKIKRRRSVLLEQKRAASGEDGDGAIVEPATPAATDAVLALRVAEVVMEQAIGTIGGLTGEEAEGKMAELLVLLWRACLQLEAGDADVSRVRTTLEERMAAMPDEAVKWQMTVERRLAEGEDLVEALSSKDWASAGIEEIRWAMRRLKEQGEEEDDSVAATKSRELLQLLVSRSSGSSGGECSEAEVEEWARGLEEVEGEEQRRAVMRAVERFPRRALFWRLLLESEGKELEGLETVIRHAEKINKAIEKAIKHAENINKAIEKAGDDDDTEEAFRLYQLAIDTAIQHFPTTVEKVFRSSIDGSVGDTHRAIKQLRVDYLVSIVEEGEEAEEEKMIRWQGVERRVRECVQRRPNSIEFYVHVGESLLSLATGLSPASPLGAALDALVDETLAAAVAEHPESEDAWIARCELLMEREPLKVASVYRRAILSLKGAAVDSFITRYTVLQQAAAARSG